MDTRFQRAVLLASALFLAAAPACGRGASFEPPPDPMVGKAAPPFVLHTVHKKAYTSENFDGQTLVLIFVRAGQPEVQTLLREMEKMHREPALAAVQFEAVIPEEPITEPFWIGLGNSLPFGLDYTDVAGRYGAGSLPMVVVRDFRGKIRLRLDGFVGKDFHPRLAATRRAIQEAEEERTRPPSTTP